MTVAEPDFDLKLLDGGRFRGRFDHHLRTSTTWSRGVVDIATPGYGDDLVEGEIRKTLAEIRRTSEILFRDPTLRKRAIVPACTKEHIEGIRPPESYMFGKLDWRILPMGTEVNLTWNMAP